MTATSSTSTVPGLLAAEIRSLSPEGDSAIVWLRWEKDADTSEAWRTSEEQIIELAGLLPSHWRIVDASETAAPDYLAEVVELARKGSHGSGDECGIPVF